MRALTALTAKFDNQEANRQLQFFGFFLFLKRAFYVQNSIPGLEQSYCLQHYYVLGKYEHTVKTSRLSGGPQAV